MTPCWGRHQLWDHRHRSHCAATGSAFHLAPFAGPPWNRKLPLLNNDVVPMPVAATTATGYADSVATRWSGHLRRGGPGDVTIDLGVFIEAARDRFRELPSVAVRWAWPFRSYSGVPPLRAGSRRRIFPGWLARRPVGRHIFVFLAIFSYFSVSRPAESRLFWGISARCTTRARSSGGGGPAAEVSFRDVRVRGVPILTSGRLLVGDESDVRPARTPCCSCCVVSCGSGEYAGTRFMVHRDGRWLATPLLLVLGWSRRPTSCRRGLDPRGVRITQDVFIVTVEHLRHPGAARDVLSWWRPSCASSAT